MINSRSEVLGFLKANKAFLYSRFGITKIGVFGSLAREENTEKSDIDIIIEFEDNTEDLYDKKLELRAFLTARFNTSIDLCREKSIRPVFKPLIMKDVLYA